VVGPGPVGTGPVRATARWLRLREPADASARAVPLVELLRPRLPAEGPVTVHDLGAGTGSTARWLAPLLTGPQHWVLYERDEDLLACAATEPAPYARDGGRVTVATRLRDITRLPPGDLAGAGLVTASALLDMLTADDLRRMLRLCTGKGSPLLLALTVVGRVALNPSDPLDARMAAAFNAHQRRTTSAGRLLGPDAVDAAVDELRGTGARVVVRPSPWRLDPAHADLTAAWFEGWVHAAYEQEPALAEVAGAYRDRRLAQAAAGELAVTVGHADLLVLP